MPTARREIMKKTVLSILLLIFLCAGCASRSPSEDQAHRRIIELNCETVHAVELLPTNAVEFTNNDKFEMRVRPSTSVLVITEKGLLPVRNEWDYHSPSYYFGRNPDLIIKIKGSPIWRGYKAKVAGSHIIIYGFRGFDEALDLAEKICPGKLIFKKD